MKEMTEETEATLREMLAVMPQIEQMAILSGMSLDDTINGCMTLLRNGHAAFEDGPNGFKIIPRIKPIPGEPAPKKPKKRRLFRA